MKKYKVLSVLVLTAALLLSHIMCAHIAFQYSNMLWGIKEAGYSAPANIVFLLVVPYVLGILVCLVLSRIFWKKATIYSCNRK